MIIGSLDTLENGLRISVDWLSFTVKSFANWKSLAEHFGLPVTQFQDNLLGGSGYRSRSRHSIYSISFLYDGRDDMGIHVDVSGSAVGYFLQCYLNKNTCCETPFGSDAYEVTSFDDTVLSDVLKDILDMGQLTRLDLAIDDIGNSYYSVFELRDIFSAGLYTSRFRNCRELFERNKKGYTGATLYLGSPKSEILLRIYDKQLEQNAKKRDSVRMPWTRWELQLRKNRATVVAGFLASGEILPGVALGILSNYLRLIVNDNARDSRCSTAPKWLAFLDGIEKLRIFQPVSEKDIEDKKDWLMKQVAPTLSAIYEYDGDLSFIYSLIENGSLRWSAELEKIVHSSFSMAS